MSDKDFPLGMEHSVRDVIEQLRPRLKFPTTLEECLVAVEKIEREAAEKLEQMGLSNGGLGMFRNSLTEIFLVENRIEFCPSCSDRLSL